MIRFNSGPLCFRITTQTAVVATIAAAAFAAPALADPALDAPALDDPAFATPASPKQLVFQISEAAARTFTLSAGWTARANSAGRGTPSSNAGVAVPFQSGIQSLDEKLYSLSPQTLAPTFNLETNTAKKRAAGLDRIFTLSYDADLSLEEAVQLVEGGSIIFCEPDYVVKKSATLPNDPAVGEQWSHRNPVFPFGWTQDADTDADLAWDEVTGDPNLIIAIVDTGVDLTHPEFAGRLLPGFDFVNNDSDPTDDEGHGTACAGIAAAAGNNGIGITGVVWDSKILPVKVLDDEGSGLSSWVADGIEFAADNGAKVISMSLGSESASSVIQAAVNYAFNTHGAILFGATGNDNQSFIEYPGRFGNVMAVGSMSPCNERKNPNSCDGESWWGSDYGPGIDFLAPGVLMKTTDIVGAGGYSFNDYTDNFNGTSSATPYAAGVAALIWSYDPSLTNVELSEILRTSAEDMGEPGYDLETGYGHVNPANAIEVTRFRNSTTVALGNSGAGRGLSFIDYDDDGDADLYITNDGDANVFLRNDNGTFVDAGLGSIESSGPSFAAAFGDADGDGDVDLYLADTDANHFFANESGSFVETTTSPLDDSSPSSTTSWIDYDNDGDLDLYTTNDGQNKILENDGAGTFTDVSVLPLGNSKPGHGFAWGDYDSDGDMDLYITNDGPNRLLQNQGGGTFTNDTGNLLDNIASHGALWGDVDNDGDMDLFVTNETENNRLWINDGGSFSDVATGNLARAGASWGVAMADYNLDGWLDILVTNDDGTNQLFRNESGESFSQVANRGFLADSGSGRGAAFADTDCDGDLDFYIVNADRANIFVENMQPIERNWVQFRLIGVDSNGAGIGARVRIVSGDMSQIREITAGSGYASQSDAVAHFGLGNATVIDTVAVTWPNGNVDVATNVLANEKFSLIEGGTVPISVTEIDTALPILQLGTNHPNPLHHSTAIPFRTENAGVARLEIFSVEGRRVKTLFHGRITSGSHSFSWNRRNEKGKPVGSGVYFYRLSFEGSDLSRSLIVR